MQRLFPTSKLPVGPGVVSLLPSCLLTLALSSSAITAQWQVDTLAALGGGGSLSVPFEPISAAFLDDQIVITMANGELPAAFNRKDGRYLGSIGAKGEGPGEFSIPYEVVALPGDSLAVLDVGTARMTVFSPDGSVARSLRALPRIKRIEIRAWPEDVLGTGLIFTPERAGYPIHRVDMSGEVVRIIGSFGGDGDFSVQNAGRLERHLGIRSDGGFVAGHQTSFQLEGWSSSDEREWETHLQPPWFRVQSNLTAGFSDEAPPPMMDAVQVDEDGLIWSFFRVPSRDWASHWPKGLLRGVEYPSSVVPEVDKLWGARIQVVDPIAIQVVDGLDLDGVVVEAEAGSDGMVVLLTTTDEATGEYSAVLVHIARQ